LDTKISDLTRGNPRKLVHKCDVCGEPKETPCFDFFRDQKLSHLKCKKVKFKQTNLKRYGVESPLQSPTIKAKAKETCIRNYGVASHRQSKKVQDKYKQTCIKKYGVDNPRKSKQIKDKICATNKERYGVEHPAQSKVVHDKMQQSCLEKYGVDNVFRLDAVKERIRQTIIEKYGVEHPAQAEQIRLKAMLPFEFVKSEIEKVGYTLLSSTYEGCEAKLEIQCGKGDQYWGTWTGFKKGYRCPKCRESQHEKKLGEILEQIFPGQVKKQDNLGFLGRLRVDYSIRSLKLAFEYDGEQHFRPVCYGSMEEAQNQLEKQQKRDIRKDKLCKQNEYHLIRIAYYEDLNIEIISTKIRSLVVNEDINA